MTGRVYRPNKLAQGMSDTYERSKKSRLYQLRHNGHKHDVLKLLVRGTCDVLGTSFGSIGRRKCACCNGTGRAGFDLTAIGQRRLNQLRKKRTTL